MMEKLRKISKTYYLRQIMACLMVYCILLGIPAQVAKAVNPGDVVNIPSGPGSVNFIGSGPGNTVVNVQSNKAIINWRNFDTIPGELISFLRGTDFAVLNRVVAGEDPTYFLGTLNAPLGNVFLINSRGIMFGPSSYINARNFVASGLGMRDLDFINGDLVNPDNINYRFGYGDRWGLGPADLKSVTVDSIGDVTNEGIGTNYGINAENVALIGKSVLNQGTIRTTTGGTVIMAAGETVLLSEVGSNVVVEVGMTVPAQHTVNNAGTIEASSGNVGKVVLAAGDIISAAITGVDSLAAVANRNVDLGGDFEAGEITLTADADGVDGGRVYAGGIVPGDALTSTTGDIEISASDDTKIQLNNVDIDAAEDLLLNNNTMVSPGKTLKAGQDVILADTKTMMGYGDLTVEGDRDIILGGDVWAYGTLTLKADADTVDHEPGATTGGKMLAKSTLRTMFGNGNIDIYGNAILLDNHVTADGDLILNDNTIVKDTGDPGIKLKAGRHVVLADDKSLTGDGALTVEAGSDISLRGPVEAKGAGNVNLTAINGNVWVDDVKAIDNQITIDSGGVIREYGSDPGADLTAYTLDLTANDGIGDMSATWNPIETAANTITAKTDDDTKAFAHIVLLNRNDSPTSLKASTVGTSSWLQFIQEKGGELTLTDVSTDDGTIQIDAYAGNIVATQVNAGGEGNVELKTIASGDVVVDNVQALGDEITINSAGAITEYGNDPKVDLTADTLNLTAKGGIAYISPTWDYIETVANNIFASTTDPHAHIVLHNDNVSPTSLNASTVGGSSYIIFNQTGGGELTLADVSTVDGRMNISAEEGDIVALHVDSLFNAGGPRDVELTTLTSGNVRVDDVKALDDQITINSAGAISEYGDDPEADLTADTLLLIAKDGIGDTLPMWNPIETAADTIIARTEDDTKTGAHIALSNNNTSPTFLTASTVGTDSWVAFNQTGGGELTLTDVSTVNGGISIAAFSGDIASKLVNAGGQFGDVYLATYDSGDITVGSVTADGDVYMGSAGSINDADDDTAVDITAGYLGLTARDEIGGNPPPPVTKDDDTLGAIETDVDILEARSTGLGGEDGGGDIVIVETDDVELQDVIAESGSIFLEATNGGMTHILPEEDEDPFIIKAGGSTLTLVQQNDLELEYFTFANQENTDLMMESYEGSITAIDTASGGKDENAADQWQSIQAIAKDNIVLQGSDSEEDIKIGLHEGFDPSSHPFGGVVHSWDGGVSIISENGAVRTADDTILDDVEIWGISDDEENIGVDLPHDPDQDQKAAIVIMSEDTLTLGEDTKLTASGWYDTTGDVDDRVGVGFLDVSAEIPSGYPRYKGDPFDAAIYLASTDGDVDVSSPVSITSFDMDGLLDDLGEDQELPEPIPSHVGAMVIDAFDSVTFGEAPGSPFEVSLANGEVGDRLEVASRITEWLFQAAGRLPYSSYPYYGGGPFPLDYTYVLRGAGLENPAISGITEGLGRAWVLVDPQPAPLDREAGELAERLTLGLEGCPVLVAAASAELGIPGETIEVYLADAFALNTDIQPCESCARLVNAGAILRDEDGSRMAAMNQVFNELAPADAPFTPEMAASIVTAFAGRVNDGTQYATAIEYIDAFVQYIAVLDTEMGAPVGDSIAFVMQKYGTGLTESENNNIAAFVATRLESGETFAD